MVLDAEKDILALGFVSVYSSAYAEVFANKEGGIIACVLTADYVPITDFRLLFGEISEVIKSGGYHKFIFDKRTLRTFHQPSMEWYFLNWKVEMIAYGLTKHRKILPDLLWFKKAVEIARDPLVMKFPDGVYDQLDIAYRHSLEEAVLD